MAFRCHPRYSPHDVDAKLKAKSVHILRQPGKTASVSRGRKSVRTGLKSSPLVDFIISEGNILKFFSLRACVVGIPLNIHNHILPSILLQIRSKKISVIFYLLLVDCGIIVIIAVPAHRRRNCKFVFVHFFPHFCAHFLHIPSLCQVRADTNPAIEKLYFSILSLHSFLLKLMPLIYE